MAAGLTSLEMAEKELPHSSRLIRIYHAAAKPRRPAEEQNVLETFLAAVSFVQKLASIQQAHKEVAKPELTSVLQFWAASIPEPIRRVRKINKLSNVWVAGPGQVYILHNPCRVHACKP